MTSLDFASYPPYSLTGLRKTVITPSLWGLFMESALKLDPLKEKVSIWVEEHGDYLFSYALRHFRSHSEAEDLVQETFLGALQSGSKFNSESSVRTWLTGILRHKIFDRIRKKNLEQSNLVDSKIEDSTLSQFNPRGHWKESSAPSDCNLNPAEAYERNDFVSKVQACLESLPDKFRSIFLMRELDGLSREEIGQLNGYSANNIGVMLHRARSSLRECLEKSGLK